jgi:hypothetical protein
MPLKRRKEVIGNNTYNEFGCEHRNRRGWST